MYVATSAAQNHEHSTSDFKRCDNRDSDLRRSRFFMRGSALNSVTSWDWKNVALVCALLLRTRNVKERKKFWISPITRQRLHKGKFNSLYEDLWAHPQTFFFLDISECLVQHLIKWFCLVQILHFMIPERGSPYHQKKGQQWHYGKRKLLPYFWYTFYSL